MEDDVLELVLEGVTITAGSEIEVDDELSMTSTNPVQNKVITANLLNVAVNAEDSLTFWYGLPTV